ncbi:hypothetical protein D3C71_111360 [compost metagenome]
MKFSLFSLLSFSNTSLWALAGVLTLCSNYYGHSTINYIAGLFLLLCSVFWYQKYISIRNITLSCTSETRLKPCIRKVVYMELLMIIVMLVLVIIINSGVIYRVFVEHMPVFD